MNRRPRMAAARLILLPDMWKVRAYQDKIPGVQWRDVIANQPVSIALDGKRELVFRMEVPRGTIA